VSTFDLIESDVWPRLRQQIEAQIEERLENLLNVATLDGMRQQQGWIECARWVLDQAKPPKPRDEGPGIYD
jgi:hypothetical protein